MTLNVKTLALSAGFMVLGVGSTYWLMADTHSDSPQAQHPAQQDAFTAQTDANETNSSDAETLTHERFLAEANERRERQLAEQEEQDRLDKLRHQQAGTVECKFWQQQPKTDSNREKVEQKINQHCLIASDLNASNTGPETDTNSHLKNDDATPNSGH